VEVVYPVIGSVTKVVMRACVPSALSSGKSVGAPVRVRLVPIWVPVVVLINATRVVVPVLVAKLKTPVVIVSGFALAHQPRSSVDA
jgi:hypothetical protein